MIKASLSTVSPPPPLPALAKHDSISESVSGYSKILDTYCRVRVRVRVMDEGKEQEMESDEYMNRKSRK